MRRLLLPAALFAAALLPAADPVPEDDSIQDVVFLGEGRPAYLRLHVRNGDASAFVGYDAFMEKLFAFLDRDGSGALSRVEAMRAPSVAQMNQYLTGNPFIVERTVRPGMMATPPLNVEDLDPDRDGRVTMDELRAYYRANGVGSLVVVNQTANDGSAGAVNDLVFAMLDLNRDGKLSREELLAADREILRLDRDDDELISGPELGVTPRQNPRGRALVQPDDEEKAPPPKEPPMGLEVIPRLDRRLAAKLDAARKVLAKYDADKDGRLSAKEMGIGEKAFAKIDRNRDGRLDSLELGRWLMGPPDSEHMIRLAAPNGRGTPFMAAARGAEFENLLTMGHLQLSVIPQPLTAFGSFDFRGQILSQFRTFDTARAGYLTRKQVDSQSGAAMRALIEVADRNSDGRMTRQELVDYLDLVATASLAQVSLTLTSSGQGLFQALDGNGDGYLSVRELRDAWARLAPFDADRDEAVSRAEFPTQVRLTVGRGGQQAGFDPEGGAVSQGRPVPTRGPLWFRKMDRNGDGDVSRSEWLGTADDFDRADTDRDGLISLAEALALDATLRK